MAAPLAPIAITVLRYAALVAIAYAATRTRATAPRDINRDAVLDRLTDGVAVDGRSDGWDAAGRMRRVLRLGRRIGRGVEIDLAALVRLRLRRV